MSDTLSNAAAAIPDHRLERILAGFNPGKLASALILPTLGILVFLLAWHLSASRI